MPSRKSFTWPIRRLLDPRFADITERIWSGHQVTQAEAELTRKSVAESVNAVVGGYAASSVESLSHVGGELRQLEQAIEELRERLDERADELARSRARDLLGQAAADGAGLELLGPELADVLNFAASHRGYAAQAGLWFNPPVSVRHRPAGVDVGSVNERIVEVPFAFRAIGSLPAGARVLDFGAAESQIAHSLAALGYAVTALDLRTYPLPHPNLRVVTSPLEEWDAPPGSFDAVLCISTVEHVGLHWYGDEGGDDDRADLAAMRRLSELLDADGVLVLTVPYGRAGVDRVQRTYDRAGLDELLTDWDVRERLIVEQSSPGTWAPVDDSTGHAVALVVAGKR